MAKGEYSTIKYDECLSSWVARNKCCFDPEDLDFYEKSDGDIDFDFSLPALMRLISKTNLSLDHLRRRFACETKWTLPRENRMAYCLACMREDISAGGAPCWRKSWCYVHCPICLKHRVLLSIGSPLGVDFQKAWYFFFASCHHELGETRCLIPWRQSNASTEAILLAFRVQQLLVSAHRRSSLLLPGGTKLVDSADFLVFSRFLLEEFLFPRMRGVRVDGAARGSQSGLPRENWGESLQEVINIGFSECNAFCRVVALVLVGRIFKLFPQERFYRVRDSLGLGRFAGDFDAESVGKFWISTPRRSAWYVAELLSEGFSDELNERLNDFYKGLSWRL